VTDVEGNFQQTKNLATIFALFVLFLTIIIIGVYGYLLYFPITDDTHSIAYNCSIEGNITILNTPLICGNCSLEQNETIRNENSSFYQKCSIQGNATILKGISFTCYNCSLMGNVTFQNATLLFYQNCSIKENVTIQNSTPLVFQNCSFAPGPALLQKIHQLFMSSTISSIYNSYYTKDGFLNLVVNNFAIFLAIIGVLSLYCYFYYNITFNADVISEYPESQQQNLKIFLQALYPTFGLLAIYLIFVWLSQLSIKPIESCLLGVFFILEFVASGIFYEYRTVVYPSFENRIQFAALRDSFHFFDLLIYFISISCFILPFIVFYYGISSDFNVLSIIFTICIILIMIWQINIVNNESRSIFDIKTENLGKIQGFFLSRSDNEIIRILINEPEKNKIVHIPRSHIEFYTLNRTISKSEVKNPSNVSQTLYAIWDSMGIFKNIIKTMFGFSFGFIMAFVLFYGFAAFSLIFELPLQILVLVFLISVLILGFICGRSFNSLRKPRNPDR